MTAVVVENAKLKRTLAIPIGAPVTVVNKATCCT